MSKSFGRAINGIRILIKEAPENFSHLSVKDEPGLSCASEGKESTYNAGDLGSIPGSGRSPGEGNGYSLQCSCLENPME